jgi:serine/threonine protein kinase
MEELLGAADHTEIEAHVETCSDCQQTLQALAGDSSLADAPVPAPMVCPDLLDRLKRQTPTPRAAMGAELGPVVFPGPPTTRGPLGQLDTYHVAEQLGSGSFGVVFKAYDAALDQPVALKLCRPTADGPAAHARFEREARKAASVRHPHVVAVHRFGTVRGFPYPYIVMELVEGISLAERLRREKVLPPVEAARVLRQVALGLQAAHERGLVHRDIKPANVMQESLSGSVKITDFGLARAVESEDVQITHSGENPGTPSYMSPEQIASPKQVDARSDLFSLGVVFYQLLTGELPFRGQTLMVLQQIRH